MWFSWTNHDSFGTHNKQWDRLLCINNSSRQMAFFVFVKVGGVSKGRLLSHVEDFEIKSFFSGNSFLYYCIKQVDSMLPCVCSVIDHRSRQNVVRTSMTHLAIASCATFFCSYHILTSSVIYYCTDARQHCIYFNC